MADKLTRIGRVTNNWSNFLEMLAIDASHLAAWSAGGGDDDDDDDDDGDDDDETAEVRVGKGTGVLVEIGGCGSSEVLRAGSALVMVEHFSGDDDADAEAELERAIASTPTTDATRLGTVKIETGVLALWPTVDAGQAPKPGTLAKVKVKGAAKLEHGCLIATANGRYDIWGEQLEIEGDWGSIGGRIRIVPAGTRIVAGAPILELARPAPLVAASGGRREVPEWTAVSSMAIAADGRAFAGENGGFRACGWNPDGTLAWHRTLKEIGSQSRYNYELSVQLVGDDLVAHAKEGTTLWLLDPATGATRHELTIPQARTVAVSPDRERLVLRVDTETVVLAYPTLERLAKFDDYCNQNGIAISDDSRWLAVNGHEVHVYDLEKLARVATFEPPESPWATCFTPDGRLLTGDDTGRARLYDTTGKKLLELDAAPDRKRKPTITAVAASKAHVAIGRDDGTVALFDHDKQLVKTFDKHDVTQPDTGSFSLGAVAFSVDGTQLWVSAGPKKQPVGLSVYRW
jgi:hypothetical protein